MKYLVSNMLDIMNIVEYNIEKDDVPYNSIDGFSLIIPNITCDQSLKFFLDNKIHFIEKKDGMNVFYKNKLIHIDYIPTFFNDIQIIFTHEQKNVRAISLTNLSIKEFDFYFKNNHILFEAVKID